MWEIFNDLTCLAAKAIGYVGIVQLPVNWISTFTSIKKYCYVGRIALAVVELIHVAGSIIDSEV